MAIILLKFKDKEKASKTAAEMILGFLEEIPRHKKIIFGTATGQSPVLTYKEFANFVSKIPHYDEWAKEDLAFRQLDNYISPGATKDALPEYSYELELERSIWKTPHAHHCIPREWAMNPEEEAERYAEIVRRTTTNSDYYFQLLGIGDKDGHIAFNMPGDSFDSRVHIVDLNEETISANADKFFGGDTTKVPKKAITTGIGDILMADWIMLEAFGEKKADIIWKSLFTEPTTDIPATALQTFKGTVVVILDEKAASTVLKKEGESVFSSFGETDEEKRSFIWKKLINK